MALADYQTLVQRFGKAEADRLAAELTAKGNTISGYGSAAPSSDYSGTTSATTTTTSMSGRDKRMQEMQNFTGWDNDPAVRSIQERWWQIYVDTGRKDTPEQLSLNEQAQKARRFSNPMYDPSLSKWGPTDWMDAAKITPPDSPGLLSGIDSGGIASVGVLALIALAVVSIFRG